MKDYEKMVNCNDTYCEYFDERMELNCAYSEDNSECIKTIEPLSSHAVLGEVRTGGSLANKLSNCVHDNCKDVPHDIGLKLISIVREHLV